MVFYGASGHCKVVLESFVASGGAVTGIIDDNHEVKSLLSYKVSYGYEAARFGNALYIVSIGDNCIRKRISESIRQEFGRVIHPGSTISHSAIIGNGSVVMAGVIMNAGSSAGKHVILNTGCIVDHDCVISDFVHVAPNATLCGGVFIGEGTHIGAGATLIQNVKIGKWAVIGAGAVVTSDVPDYAVAVGVPAKTKRFNRPLV